MTSSGDQLHTASGGGSGRAGHGGLRVVEMSDLTRADLDRWLDLRAGNPALDSPYFHPGFAAAVASTRPGVRVAIGGDASGVPASFLPIQVDRRTSRPVGWPAADFQGPICASGVIYDISAAIAACGASSYEFDHLHDGIAGFERWTFGEQESPYLEVEGGIDGYLSRASRSGKDKVAEARRLSNKAEREHGPVRFVADSTDLALLDATIAMKRRQYTVTGSRDYFADDRHMKLLHTLFNTRESDFGGILSAVYAGPPISSHHTSVCGQVRYCTGGFRSTSGISLTFLPDGSCCAP